MASIEELKQLSILEVAESLGINYTEQEAILTPGKSMIPLPSIPGITISIGFPVLLVVM